MPRSSAAAEVRRVASELPYRDFITVGLLLTWMKSRSWAATGSDAAFPPDNWIYIQGRRPRRPASDLQQLESAMVADPALIALGVEYFCNRDDESVAVRRNRGARHPRAAADRPDRRQ
jgi:hypothetical protein